jgi:hypothetical protein
MHRNYHLRVKAEKASGFLLNIITGLVQAEITDNNTINLLLTLRATFLYSVHSKPPL